jgi:hypothetical protein
MKTILNLIVFVVSILYCGITYGQNENLTLTSPDIIKGLDNKDYLREKLTENGFIMVGKEGIDITKTGSYEYWKFSSMVYVDFIYNAGQKNTIKVGINEAFKDLPERLIQSFPHKKIEKRDERKSNIYVTPINKKTSYYLVCSRDTDNVAVMIWFDNSFYFFEYKHEK